MNDKELKQLDQEIIDLFNKRISMTRNSRLSEIESLANTLTTMANNQKYQTSFKENPVVGYQGVAGAFSQQAVQAFFNEDTKNIGYPEFEDVYIALQEGKIDYGMLPIENSLTGAINDNYDLIRKYGFYIVGEVAIKVDQCLMALPGTKLEDITQVYSHPQGLAQTSEFFFAHRKMEPMPYKDTAMAARYVKERNERHKAAIASSLACKLYGLEMLAPAIQNDKSNKTRFMVISKNFITPQDSDKISILFTLSDNVGSLYNMLQITSLYGINLVKIESRPMKERNWEYYFYIDVDGNIREQRISQAIEEMKTKANTFRLLGNYKKA